LRDAIANGLKSEFDAFQWVEPRKKLRIYPTKAEDSK